jgi:hypothetical protein
MINPIPILPPPPGIRPLYPPKIRFFKSGLTLVVVRLNALVVVLPLFSFNVTSFLPVKNSFLCDFASSD